MRFGELAPACLQEGLLSPGAAPASHPPPPCPSFREAGPRGWDGKVRPEPSYSRAWHQLLSIGAGSKAVWLLGGWVRAPGGGAASGVPTGRTRRAWGQCAGGQARRTGVTREAQGTMKAADPQGWVLALPWGQGRAPLIQGGAGGCGRWGCHPEPRVPRLPPGTCPTDSSSVKADCRLRCTAGRGSPGRPGLCGVLCLGVSLYLRGVTQLRHLVV